jgi:hypothetical protein
MMTSERRAERDADQPMVYQIRIKGHLGQQWLDWFDGLTITLEEDGDTLLTGSVIDQAALYGILKKIRDLGMPLLSINSDGLGSSDIPDVKS